MNKFHDLIPVFGKFDDLPPMNKFEDIVIETVSTKPQLADFTPYTVAWVLQRYYEKFEAEILSSQRYTMRRLQKSPHFQVLARELKKSHVQAHAEMRIDQGVKPSTVGQDITYLRVALKYAGSAWDDCEGITDGAITAALPFLKKENIIAKSAARDRLPEEEEIAMLRAYYREQAKHLNTKIPMELMMDWQIASGRRRGETCKLLWEDWDREAQTIVVRKMKANKKPRVVALTDDAQAMLVELYEKRDPSEPRIFPYNAASVGCSFTIAKNRLKIPDLRLHDFRAKCYTKMREKGIPASIAILVTAHKAEALPERVYKRMKAHQFKTLQHVRAPA